MNDFQQEWAIIHHDIEKYERFSLLIKLFSVFICAIFVIYDVSSFLTILFVLILWLQDSICKTFQKRLEERIIFIESKQSNDNNDNSSNGAFQLYRQWQDQRPDIQGLVNEYLMNAIKPTIAYPYGVLVIVMLFY